MIIAIDFDGTCVSDAFPYIGNNIGSVTVIKKMIRAGHKIILNTVRSGKYLAPVIEWFRNNGIELYGINYNPDQANFSSSPKVYCNLFIDDLGIGAPLKIDKTISDKPFIDWVKVEQIFIDNGWL